MSIDATAVTPGIDTDEQAALRDSVRSLLRKSSGSERVRAAMATDTGFDAGLWARLAGEVGAAALAVPEEYDGVGVTAMETHVVLEELGASLTPSPMLGSGVLAIQALLAGGDAAACAEYLPGLAAGETLGALCWAGRDGRWTPAGCGVRAEVSGGEASLDGEAHYVLGGDVADLLVVLARTDTGVGLFVAAADAPGVTRERVTTMDPTRSLSVVRFAGVSATAVSPVEADGTRAGIVDRIRSVAAVALSADQVGAARALLDLTVEYTRNRTQFGRAIGSFQALKHRMADMYVAVETSRSISYAAAASLSAWGTDPETALADAAAARSWCSEAFEMVAAEAIQLHGGIGITWEADPQLYFKRAHGDATLFGTAAEYRRG